MTTEIPPGVLITPSGRVVFTDGPRKLTPDELRAWLDRPSPPGGWRDFESEPPALGLSVKAALTEPE